MVPYEKLAHGSWGSVEKGAFLPLTLAFIWKLSWPPSWGPCGFHILLFFSRGQAEGPEHALLWVTSG